MAPEPLALVVHYLRSHLAPADDSATDGELLARFVRCGEVTAFETLLRRHGPLVWRVCRRVLASEHDAEDAFQATFLVLLRKASSIRKRASVASWLYGVAHRIAVRACANAQRLRGSNLLDVAGSANVVSEASGREVQAILEEELAQLPERLRAPLLLCCLEGRSRTEAARQLGWREGTVASRLARARQRLRGRLARRGVMLSVGALAGLLERDVAAVPLTVAAAAARAAGLFVLGNAAAAPAMSTQVTVLANGALQAMFVTKLKVGATLALVCGILAAGAGLAVQRALEEKGPTAQLDGPKPLANSAESQRPDGPKQTRADYYGDPLPPGALARMGTVQLRHPSAHVVFSADGKALISGGRDRAVRFWDVGTGRQVEHKQLKPPQPSPEDFREAILAPGGKILAILEQQTVYLYETAGGRELQRISVGPVSHERLAFSPDGETLATMIGLGGKYTIRLWDVSTGKERLVVPKHQPFIQDLAFSPDGKLLAWSDRGPALHLWDTTTGKELRNVRTEERFLAFAPDGNTVASVNGADAVTLWDVATLKEQATLKPSALHRISSLAFSPDSTLLGVAGEEAVVLWDVAGQKEQRRLPNRQANRIAFAPDGKTLACSGAIAIDLWDVKTGEQLHYRPGHNGDVGCLAVSPQGNVVASTSLHDPFVHLWDAATGKPLHLLKGHDPHVRSCTFSRDGKWVVSGGSLDGTLRLWEAATGKELRHFMIEDLNGEPQKLLDAITLRLSPDAKRLAAVSLSYQHRDHYQMNVWDTSTSKVLTRRHFRGGFDSRFTPDGTGVTVENGQSLTIEETTTGRELATIPANLGRPVAFSPDGKLVAAGIHKASPVPSLGGGGYQQEGVSVAELVTGKELWRIAGWIDFVAFAPDGRVLAMADHEGIRLWDTVSGRQVFRRPWPEGLARGPLKTPIGSLAFLPGGRAAVTGMADGTLLVWDLAPETWPTIGSVKDLNRRDLDRLWTDLADDGARKAYRAIHTLAASPSQAVPFLGDHLQPAAAADPERVRQLIADLDSDRFAVRAAAAKELSGLGERIEPALRQALEGKQSAEVRKRLEALLAAPPTPRRPESVRTLRAIQVLERIGTPEAQQILRKLAAGAAAARETRDANEALERLASARE
jgi:RNA polymerase sigma factor (sigma-70 family)